MEISDRQKRALIIDLTAEIFRIGSAITPSESGTPKYPLASRVISSILDVIDRSRQTSGIPASHVVLASDADFGNLRKLIDPEYKANRSNQKREFSAEDNPYDPEKQQYLFSEQGKRDVDRLKIILQQLGFPVVSARGYEGDDVIAWAHQALRKQLGPDMPIEIYSPDKDMKVLLQDENSSLKDLTIARRGTITGKDVATSWRRDSGIDARHYSDHLALSGDRSDNIPAIFSKKQSMKLLNYIDASEESMGWFNGFKNVEEFADDANPRGLPEEFQPYWFALNFGGGLKKWKNELKEYDVEDLWDILRWGHRQGRSILAKNLELARLKPDINELDMRYGNPASFEAISRFLLPDKNTDQIRAIMKDLSDDARAHYGAMIEHARTVGHGVISAQSEKFFGLHPLSESSSFFPSRPPDDAVSESDYRKKFEDSKILFDTLIKTRTNPFLVGNDENRQYVPIVRIKNKDDSYHDIISTEAGLFARQVGMPEVNPDGTVEHNKWIHAYGYDPSFGILIHNDAPNLERYSKILGPSANKIRILSDQLNDPNNPLLTAGHLSSGIYEIHHDTDKAMFFARHLVPWHQPGVVSISARTRENMWNNFFAQHRVLSREQALGNLASIARTQQYMPDASRDLAKDYYVSTGIHGARSGPIVGRIVNPHENFDAKREFGSTTYRQQWEIIRGIPSMPHHTNIDDYGRDLFDTLNSPYDDSYLAAVIAATPKEAQEYRKTGIPSSRIRNGTLLMPLKQLKEHFARSEADIANGGAYSVPELFSSHPALASHKDDTGERASELFIAHIEPRQARLRQAIGLGPVHFSMYGDPPITMNHIAANIPFSPAAFVPIPKSVKLPSELHRVPT